MEEMGAATYTTILDEETYGVKEGEEADNPTFEPSTTEHGTTVAFYPANILAACHAASSTYQHTLEDTIQYEKRRKSNRLNSRRWRLRKKSKFSELFDQIKVLQQEQESLTLEKSKLELELKLEVALMNAETSRFPSSFLNAGPQNVQQPLSFNPLLGPNLDLIAGKALPTLVQAPPLAHRPSLPEIMNLHSVRALSTIASPYNQFMPVTDLVNPSSQIRWLLGHPDETPFPVLG